MTTPNTTVNNRDNAHELTPDFWWGWPDETRLAAFAEQAEMADRLEQAKAPLESNCEYAVLYFVS